MPAPTPDELYDYLGNLINEKTAYGPHPIFEWEYLITCAFRHFKSTSNAVRSRMEKLLADGRLSAVEISASGFLYLKGMQEIRMFPLYFQYENSSGNSYYDNWGLISLKRPKGLANVWRNGDRNLFTTTDRLTTLTAAAIEEARNQRAASKQAREEELRKADAALNEIAPDATELLARLRDIAQSEDDGEVNYRTRTNASEDEVSITLHLYNAKSIGPFLDILRRGLPDVPRETSES